MTLVLETLGGDQTLDLGGLGVGGLALTLGLDLATNDVLADLLMIMISIPTVVYSRNSASPLRLPRIFPKIPTLV